MEQRTRRDSALSVPAAQLKYGNRGPKVQHTSRNWPDKILSRAPTMLSTDLRDGNQALPSPMVGVNLYRGVGNALTRVQGLQTESTILPSACRHGLQGDRSRYALCQSDRVRLCPASR